MVWTRLRHRAALHQTATTTAPNRYPEVFAALAERLAPQAKVLSFGCSTGEELLALRQHLPDAHITGVEINSRARQVAAARTADDTLSRVVATLPTGSFDAVLALSVLQREPHRVFDEGITDLGRHYPFARFDAGLFELAAILAPGGLLAVVNAQYRVEDSSVAALLEPLDVTLPLDPPLFDRNSRLYDPSPPAASMFRKCSAIATPQAQP